MQKFIEVTGKNDEEALAKGLKQLGLSRDDVSLEILERGRTGFLGIGSVPAKIRLTYEAPDEPAPPPPPPPVAETPRPPRQEPKKQPKAPRESARPASRPAPAPMPTAPAAPAGADAPGEEGVAEAIAAFQTGLFQRMGVQAVPHVSYDGQAYQVTLEGENLGPLIGHRGETLDAIQQLTGYAVNKDRARRVRIHVDAEGYRARREETLTRLAQKMAGKAVRYRRNMTLEPMNAYERHVIHAALQDYPGIATRSTGMEPNRRVIVIYAPQ